MKQIFKISYLTILIPIIYACGGSEAANDKQAELKALKEQRKELESRIAELEKEVDGPGGPKTNEANKVLVTSIKMQPKSFQHKIEVRGTVASRKNVMISAETMGRVQAINVTEGQKVTKGTLLMQLEADIVKSNIMEMKTQLELANTMFERQSKLWEQNIGTEVQYLQAKNNKESLESKLKTLQAQLNQSYVYAPFSGVIDNIPAKVAEMAQPGMPLIRIVNQNEMYIATDVSESYLGKFKEGQEVEIHFPTFDKNVSSKIQAVGEVIKSENRTFEVEVSLPKINFSVKPNQVAVLRMVDYVNTEAMVVPTKIIQRDSKGSYVFELQKDGSNTRAKKVYVTPGVSFNGQTEILKGLSAGQVVAYEGYRDLAQDVLVSVR